MVNGNLERQRVERLRQGHRALVVSHLVKASVSHV